MITRDSSAIAPTTRGVERERALELYNTRADAFEYISGTRWIVPSQTDSQRVYETDCRGRCECEGFFFHNHCTHIKAARLAAIRSDFRQGCGHRFPYRQLREAGPDAAGFYENDLLCRWCSTAA